MPNNSLERDRAKTARRLKLSVRFKGGTITILCISLMLLTPIGVMAAEPDFYLVFQECKMIIGSLTNGSLNVGPGDPPTFGCSRQGKNIACIVSYPSGGKPDGSPAEAFEVLLDSPPYLYFASANND